MVVAGQTREACSTRTRGAGSRARGPAARCRGLVLVVATLHLGRVEGARHGGAGAGVVAARLLVVRRRLLGAADHDHHLGRVEEVRNAVARRRLRCAPAARSAAVLPSRHRTLLVLCRLLLRPRRAQRRPSARRVYRRVHQSVRLFPRVPNQQAPRKAPTCVSRPNSSVCLPQLKSDRRLISSLPERGRTRCEVGPVF